MVGSGKSTACKHLVTRLQESGVEAEYVRFQSLRLLPFSGRASSPADAAAGATRVVRSPRAHGFRLRRLTLFLACGYLARILAFRLRWWRRRNELRFYVLDRYFYDSFVHYELTSRVERVYVQFLRWVMPIPDVAVLLLARPETIAARRPDYAPEYVNAAARTYDELPRHFPQLVAIHTDPGERSTAHLDRLVTEWTAGAPTQTAAATLAPDGRRNSI
jgi:thymidylate kinase